MMNLLMSGIRVLLLLIYFFHGSQREVNARVCICENYSECCSHSGVTCNSSLEDVGLNNNSVVSFCNQELELNSVVALEDLHNVSLIGHMDNTTLKCSGIAGLRIVDSSAVEIANIKFINCGIQYNDTGEAPYCSLLIISSTVTIQYTTIVNGTGRGFVMINSAGNISECNFQSNHNGGMYIEFNSEHPHSSSSHLTIEGCNFQNNIAVRDNRIESDEFRFDKFGYGGGLALNLNGPQLQLLKVINVKIIGNSASWGGGMYVYFGKMTSQNIEVQVTNVTFVKNVCEDHAGGGLDIGFAGHKNSTVRFDNSEFLDNRAFVGGGTSIYFYGSNTGDIVFSNCSWRENLAYYGAALDVAPKEKMNSSPLQISLADVTIKDNKLLISITTDLSKRLIEKTRIGPGRGTVLLAGGIVTFKGQNCFINNTDSAIYAVSTHLVFAKESNNIFCNNNGLFGGAIALIGYSTIQLKENAEINMTKNTAKALGGAIYHQSIDRHDYLFSRNCFIKFDHNISGRISFSENRATSGKEDSYNKSTACSGNNMFVTTLLPCDHKATIPICPQQIFGSHVDVEDSLQLATSGAYFDYGQNGTQEHPFKCTPGNITKIPFTLRDDMGQEVDGVFHMSIEDSAQISVDSPHIYTSDNVVLLKGEPGSNETLRITKIGFREVTLAINVTLNKCPPFFLYNNTKKTCECASDIEYKVVRECNDQTFKSGILHSYWAGYYENNTAAENFRYGICPRHYCFKNENKSNNFHNLPANDMVETEVCGKERQGILCGLCRDEYCVHYHSPDFKCDNCDTCRYGWVLYLVSEILPLMLLFLFIISLDISFTSGYLNGFILFSQVFDSVVFIGIDSQPANTLIRIVQTVYKLFNFDFFSDDLLSFCLWKQAQTVHLLAFRFITVAFAAALVVGTVLLMKCCARNRRFLQYTKSASMIHGLTAFLVITYTQCSNISFQLLNFSRIYALNKTSWKVLFYQGNIEYFGQKHAPYVFIAILCLSTLTLIPPLFLISYPLCYRIGALLKLSNTRFSRLLELVLPLSKLKPVFDSFQGCYKDKYRFFSGLYFVYRIALLATVLTSDPIMTFNFTQVLLCLMLAIHCICQPYVKRVHNIIDALFFSNLLIVNIMSVLGYYYGLYGQIYQYTIKVVTYAQLPFIYAPFFYLVVVMVYSVVRFCRRRLKSSTDLQATDDIIIQRLGSSDEEEEATSSTGVRYRKFSTTY